MNLHPVSGRPGGGKTMNDNKNGFSGMTQAAGMLTATAKV